MAATDTPRFDHDPVTLAPKGLLSEETRTNYLLNSATPATQGVALSSGTYILWVTGTGTCACAPGTATGTGFGTADSTTPVVFTVTSAGSVTFTVSGTLGHFQCENGNFPTSAILTTGAAATRSGDVCSGSVASYWNAAEGSIYVHGTVGRNQPSAFGLDDGSGGNSTRAHVMLTSTARIYQVNIASVNKITTNDSGVKAAGTPVKVAVTYGSSGSALYVDGAYANGNSVASNGLTVSTLRVGSRNLPLAGRQLNGHVMQIAYYAKALSTTQLQQMTA